MKSISYINLNMRNYWYFYS